MKKVIEFDFNNNIVERNDNIPQFSSGYMNLENISPNKSSGRSQSRHQQYSEIANTLEYGHNHTRSLRSNRGIESFGSRENSRDKKRDEYDTFGIHPAFHSTHNPNFTIKNVTIFHNMNRF